MSRDLPSFVMRQAIIVLEIAQHCRVEVLKLSCMAQKLYLVWDQKYGTFYRQSLKELCLLHCLKRKFVNELQRIGHDVYVKRMYKTLNFCKLTCTYIFCSVI